MKKIIAVVLTMALSTIIAAGCGYVEREYEYEGTTMTESQLEEHLGEVLEEENGYDIDVDVYPDAD